MTNTAVHKELCTKNTLDAQHEYANTEATMDILKIRPNGRNVDT
jgi:hypothetical protein